MVCISELPASHKLHDVGAWYIERLGAQQQILQALGTVCQEGRPLRVGTMCSGTDSPVAVFNALAKTLGGGLHVEHTFSCEFDGKKREWIKDNFPSLKMLFGDVMELKGTKAMNYVTNENVTIPAVDIVIAGFVCKSVSVENSEREKYKNCIQEACGKTGETFDGVLGYIDRYKPSIVVCENVKGLTIRNCGEEPVIHHVKSSFKKVGYAFEHRLLDTRDYLLPHRRNRCWMWAFKGLESQEAVEHTGQCVEALASKSFFHFDKLFEMAGVSEVIPYTLNDRKKRCVAFGIKKMAACDREKDIVIDVAKSENRAPRCIDAAPCIVPNSLPYRVQTGSILTPEQMHCVQGIYKDDFPALARYAKQKHTLTRDLAGNAFSTTVCMAVLVSCILNAPLSNGMTTLVAPPTRSRTAVTPPRRSKTRRDFSPVCARGKQSREESGEMPALKRLKHAGD